MVRILVVLGLGVFLGTSRAQSQAPETLWLEAEHFTGIKGYCWPMGDDSRQMRATSGNWGLSGPGWAAEWNQGGESGFLSIATGTSESAANVSREVEIPAAGDYELWVRYADWREATEAFQIVVEQAGQEARSAGFGNVARTEEDNEMKLYWGWAFAWDHATVSLAQGPATVRIVASHAQPVPRQVDVVVLTTDKNYSPLIKERPRSVVNGQLESFRNGGWNVVKPLARRNLAGPIPESAGATNWLVWQPPESWKPATFRNEGFLYLWNVSHTDPETGWLSDNPARIKFPYNIIDAETRADFESTWGGRDDVPIFSDPRITPVFHGVGAGIFATDPASGEVKPRGIRFAKWLDEHPDRKWGMMLNYHPGEKVGPRGIELFTRYRDRFVGSIAGESLGYFYPEAGEMAGATAPAQTRRELVAAFSTPSLAANSAKYRAVYDRDLDANPYADVISCHSIGSMAFTPICFQWGARTAGFESAAATSTLLGMRWAAMRGAARQFGGMTATYRSCNFGDSATIFSKTSSFSGPENLLDNYYSVYSGAGMTWYKFDIWHQYMSGSSMFYHEQGFDEFWKPGGTTAAGRKPVQLSPKGKLVDRFLRTTREHPDRGTPVTPIALLLDHAHGWEPATFWPNSFVNWHQQPDRFLVSDHERMLQRWMEALWHPLGPESERPITGVNEVFVAGAFGNVFDCLFAFPDLSRWEVIGTYPVVIALGELELTAAESSRLAQYVENGGTLLISAGQVSPEAAAALKLPPPGEMKRSVAFQMMEGNSPSAVQESPAYSFTPIELSSPATAGEPVWKVLARTGDGTGFCAMIDRGQGRLIYLAVPKGLCVSRELHPVVPQLIAGLRQSQMPIEVIGDVEWMVNKSAQGWLVTLLNPYGQDKPQQGITPTDYRENREVSIRCGFAVTSATDWLAPQDSMQVQEANLQLTVPAGSVRIVELR